MTVKFCKLLSLQHLKVNYSALRHLCSQGPTDRTSPPHGKSESSHFDDRYTSDGKTLGGQDYPQFPSDVDDETMAKWNEFNNKRRQQSRHAFRPKVDPQDTSIILFPGQGSQFVGMGQNLLQYPNVKDMYEIAGSILGYDLLNICCNGPKEILDKTIHCQPAVVVTSLAAIEKMREDHPKAIENCISAAGYSVGEITALMFTGAISFEHGIRLVKKRASLMQSLSEEVPSGMMTVILGNNAKLKFALHTARQFCDKKLGIENPVCCAAIDLQPEVKVIAGHHQALEFLEKNGRDFGIRRTKRLPVSGAFHTDLMKPARKDFHNYLTNIPIEKPSIPVYSNVTSHKHLSPDAIRKRLAEQLYKPVKWEQTMHVLYSRPGETGFPRTYEAGPGNQLGSILSKVNMKAHQFYKAIKV